MRLFTKLFMKEIKQIRSALLVLCIIYLSIFLYALSLNTLIPINNIFPFILLIAGGVVWAGLFVFAYSLHEEWKGMTVYQLHTLPIHRSTMMLSKYLVGVIICAVTLVGSTVCYYLFQRNTSFVIIPFKTLPFTLFALKSVSLLALLSGIACVTMGAALSVKRYRWTFGTIVCSLLFYAMFKFGNYFKYIMFSDSGRIESYLIYYWIPSIVMGFVLMIFGLILYEKFAEL